MSKVSIIHPSRLTGDEIAREYAAAISAYDNSRTAQDEFRHANYRHTTPYDDMLRFYEVRAAELAREAEKRHGSGYLWPGQLLGMA